jgi:hydrogenase expression/formation protein HypC
MMAALRWDKSLQCAGPRRKVFAMCLAIPGKVTSVTGADPLWRTGRVDFGGIIKEVSLAYVPDVKIGEYVIVHVGFALSRLDENEAKKVFQYLKEMDDLTELREGSP